MAAAATNAMSHNIPPMPMSMTSAPRIRPPRIPKGTPNINSEPQPEGSVPKGKVWVQGKWRDPASKAVKDRQEIYSRRVEKALKHETLGTNIYAYNHIRTKQVVYSLTRNMENNKIMEQLLFHGKKTVPPSLRRDMWTPYFSVHFPPTEYGVEAGKLAYRRLRELSLQRQLSPPEDMVKATEKDIEEMKAKYDPITLKDMLDHRELRLPKEGQWLPQKVRAKRLMDQKATSVADVQFVLGLHLGGLNPAQLREARLMKFKNRMAQMGRRAKTRLQKIRQLEARKRDLIRSLALQAQSMHKDEGHLGLTKHAAARISSEYLGKSKLWGGLEDLSTIEAAKKAKATEVELQESLAGVQAQIDALLTGQPMPETATEEADTAEVNSADTNEAEAIASSEVNNQTAPELTDAPVEQDLEVKIMWADPRDSSYAADEWPEAVMHGSLERWAESKEVIGRKHMPNEVRNDKGGSTPGPVETKSKLKTSRSIHVIGARQDSQWTTDPMDAAILRQRKEKTHEKRQEAAVLMEGKMEQAVEMLREDPNYGWREAIPGRRIDQLSEDLESDETRLGTTELDQEYQTDALSEQWWAIQPEDRKGIKRGRACLLARYLKLRELQQAAAGDAAVGVARRSAAEVKRDDGVEVDMPEPSWFDRMKALVWRK